MTREEAIYRLKNTAWLGTNKDREETEQAVDMAIEALSADAVSLTGTMKYLTKPHNYCEVVRCKDCKNWRESNSEDEESYCYIDGRTTDSTDYCSWGERREK